jgi:Tol biopolymer transport system component
VVGDSNGKWDIFVHDRWKKKTRRVNVKSSGTQAFDEHSFDPEISGNGRYVAFESKANNLVNNDTNGKSDVFVHDRWKKKTKRVSVRTGGGQAGGFSGDLHISANGRYVAFGSDATNLVGNDDNDAGDIFVHDRTKKKTKRVSVRSGGGEGSGGGYNPSISADGRYVAFAYDGQDLVKNDTNPTTDVFVHDRQTRKTRLVSRKSNGAQREGWSEQPSISADGRYVAFESEASLVSNDTNTVEIFMRGPLR